MIRKLSTRRKNNFYYTNYLVEDETDLQKISNMKLETLYFGALGGR